MVENLYCPRCGKQFGGEISYCRTCGLSLDGVSEIVSGDAVNAPVTSTRPNPTAIRLGIGLFLLGTILGLIHLAIRDLDLFPEIYGKAVFFILIAAGLLSMGAAAVFPSKKYTKRKDSNSISESDSPSRFDAAPMAGQLSSANPAEYDIGGLLDGREPVRAERGSVTEHTTRNLE